VQAATGLKHNELERALADLTESGLIYRRPQQHGQAFEFKHALIQEVALNTLVRQRRALLHGRIAGALEGIRAELAQREPEVLARHFEEAGNDRRAWVFWRAAGNLAAQSSSSREAVTHFTHATECLKRLGPGAVSHDEETEIYLGLSGALMRADGYRSEKLALAVQLAQRAAHATGSASLQCRVALQTAPLFYSTGRNGEYLSLVEGFSTRISKDKDPWLCAGLLTTRAVAHFNRGEYIETERHGQAAIELVADLPGTDPVRVGGADISIVVRSYVEQSLVSMGRLDEALHVGFDAERIGRVLGDPFSLAWALLIRSHAYSHLGRHEAALADADEIIALSRQRGFIARLGNGLMRRGAARAHLGELEEGIEEYREGRAMWRGSGVVFHALGHATELAGLLLMAGRAAEADALLEDVETLVAGSDEAAYLAECQRLHGMIAVAAADVASAERWLETAIATARGQGATLFDLRATTRLAELFTRQGRGLGAARRLDEVYASLTQGHGAPDLDDAKTVLDRLRD
jgi:tetratricopeptide (TPR) repeat protein